MPTERKPAEIQHTDPSRVRNGAGRFCIGNINPGNVRFEFMMSMIRLIQDDRKVAPDWDAGEEVRAFEQFIVNAPAGPYLDAERNVVVNRFMQCDADVLVFVDSDIAFKPSDIYSLVALCTESDPVVGGWYENDFPDHGRRPVAFNWSQPEGEDRPKLEPINWPTLDSITLEPFPVDVIGTGFLAIHRTILDAMIDIYDAPTPWFAELALWGQQMGEDVTFCMRVKSMKKSGNPDDDTDDFYRVLFAPIPVTHYKSIAITPSTFSPPEATQ